MAEHEKRIREALRGSWWLGVDQKDLRALLADLDAVRADAARYRWLRTQHEGVDELTYDAEGFPMPLEPTAAAYTVFRPGRDLCLEPVGCIPGELDAAIDAALKGATA